MKLSAEQFAELASSFPGYAEEREKQERRRASRLDLRAQVTIRLFRENVIAHPTVVTVNNFSPRGLGMVMHSPVEQGTQFIAELPRKSGGNVSFLCTVMHSRPISGNNFQIGVEFTCVLRQPVNDSSLEQVASELRRIRDSVLE